MVAVIVPPAVEEGEEFFLQDAKRTRAKNKTGGVNLVMVD